MKGHLTFYVRDRRLDPEFLRLIFEKFGIKREINLRINLIFGKECGRGEQL